MRERTDYLRAQVGGTGFVDGRGGAGKGKGGEVMGRGPSHPRQEFVGAWHLYQLTHMPAAPALMGE